MNSISIASRRGFTIVEPLIVIVVIAILAAISIVAYTGIQNNAHDSAVKSDLSNFAKSIQLYEAENGHYPIPGSVVLASGGLNNSTSSHIKFRPSKTAYATDVSNFYYCSGTKSGAPSFIIAARSKSGNSFTYSPSDGIQTVAGGVLPALCYGTTANWDGVISTDFGYNYGYYTVNDTWWSWTN